MIAHWLCRDLGLHIFRTELVAESNALNRLITAYLDLIAEERYV